MADNSKQQDMEDARLVDNMELNGQGRNYRSIGKDRD